MLRYIFVAAVSILSVVLLLNGWSNGPEPEPQQLLTEHVSPTPHVAVNPLPAPSSITWSSDNKKPIVFSRLSLQLSGEDRRNAVVSNAFKRCTSTISRLKWKPKATEAPFRPLLREENLDREAKNEENEENPRVEGDVSVAPQLSKFWSWSPSSRLPVTIEVADSKAALQMGVDESYSLNASHSGILIKSATNWGALNALKTLQQIVITNDGGKTSLIERPVYIEDKPLYTHRGLLLDTARHFLPVNAILRQIDALALTKMNVFHWHITDGQSWPLALKNSPEMAQGAYSAQELYTPQDIREIIEYAYARGVRVIPELDVPGHSFQGWTQLDPSLLSCATGKFSNSVNNYQLDIVNDKVYEQLKTVYDELSDLFKDDLFHVGADELDHNCFKFSKRIREWFAEDPSRTDNDLLEYWFDKSLPIFNNTQTRRLMMWEDSVLSHKVHAENIPKDVIMQTWNFAETNSIKKLVQLGHDVVVSSSDHLYLDCGYGLFLTGKVAVSACDPYKSWQTMYSYNFTSGLTESEKSQILGAEVTLFAEQVDQTVLDQKIWPRSAALAELVWSGNTDKNGKFRDIEMGQRMNNFREYLVASGINAPPLQPKYCIEHPHVCDYGNYYTHV